MFKRKEESVFDVINKYMTKKGHEMVMSLFLAGYNGHDIYVRFDYVNKLSVYKVSWFDLNYFDQKHIADYLNQQIVTKYMAVKLVQELYDITNDSAYVTDDNIRDDRVEILIYKDGDVKEFVFDRFLPLEWPFLIEPLALLFSYLPRSMDVMLNEIFGKFDGTEEKYNSLKAVKFDLMSGDDDAIFRSQYVLKGTKIFEDDRVDFLEKIDDHYLAIVGDHVNNLVNIKDDGDGYVFLWCNCRHSGYCEHIYATLLAIREKKFKPFYKVIYKGKDETLLEQVLASKYFLCFGVEGDKLLLVTAESMVFKADIMVDGKRVFEVIEDDDDYSLSKTLERYK